MSTTVETFQDLSLPIPGKEDLAKLHSSIHQSTPAKIGVCTDTYAAQGWLSYIMESIRRCENQTENIHISMYLSVCFYLADACIQSKLQHTCVHNGRYILPCATQVPVHCSEYSCLVSYSKLLWFSCSSLLVAK